MSWETYQFAAGIFLGLVAGIAIGVNAWHFACRILGWYGDGEVRA